MINWFYFTFKNCWTLFIYHIVFLSPRNAHSLRSYLYEHRRLCCHTHTHTAMPWFAFNLNGFDIWWILNCHRLKKLINAIIFVHMFGVVSDRLKWKEYIPHFTLCSFVYCIVSISYLFGSTFASLREMVKMIFKLALTGCIQLGVIDLIILCVFAWVNMCVQRLITFFNRCYRVEIFYTNDHNFHTSFIFPFRFIFICLEFRSLCHSCELFFLVIPHSLSDWLNCKSKYIKIDYRRVRSHYAQCPYGCLASSRCSSFSLSSPSSLSIPLI